MYLGGIFRLGVVKGGPHGGLVGACGGKTSLVAAAGRVRGCGWDLERGGRAQIPGDCRCNGRSLEFILSDMEILWRFLSGRGMWPDLCFQEITVAALRRMGENE